MVNAKVMNLKINGKQYQTKEFAKEIKLNEILSCFDEKTLKTCKPQIEQMFNNIAGRDKVLQGEELKSFLEEVIQLSKNGELASQKDFDKLATSEATNFAGLYRGGIFAEFLPKLLDLNNKKINEEKKTAEADVKKSKDLEKSTQDVEIPKGANSYTERNADGSSVQKITKDGKLIRKIERNVDNKITIDVEYNADGTRTYHKHAKKVGNMDTTDATVTLNKDDKVVKKGYIKTDGTRVETFYDNKKKTKEITRYPGGDTRTRVYDDKGRVSDEKFDDLNTHYEYYGDTDTKKTETLNFDGSKGFTTKYYNKEGVPTKSITKKADGKTEKTTFDPDHYEREISTIYYDTDGKTKTGSEEFIYGNNEYVAQKIVSKDSTGNITGVRTREFAKDANENTYVKKEVYKDEMSTTTEIFTPTGDISKRTIENPDTGVVETTIYKKNRTEESVSEKGKLKYTKTTTVDHQRGMMKSIITNSHNETVRVENSTDNVTTSFSPDGMPLRQSEYTKSGEDIIIDFANGKRVCSRTISRDNKTVYKDAKGQAISKSEYNDLLNMAKTANNIYYPERFIGER